MNASSVSIAVWIGLIMTPVTISVGQILFKISSEKLDQANLAGFIRLSLDPVFILAVGIYAAATFLWVFVLRSVPLSIAYSFMAITYLAVPLLSAQFLGEVLNMRSYLGAALIIGGVLVINS